MTNVMNNTEIKTLHVAILYLLAVVQNLRELDFRLILSPPPPPGENRVLYRRVKP